MGGHERKQVFKKYSLLFERSIKIGGEIMKRLKNCLRVKTRFPRYLYRCMYVYADLADPISYKIFEQHGIRSICSESVDHLNQKYCVIACEIKHSERRAFLKALGEVQQELDCRDYTQYCDTMVKAMKKYMTILMGPYCY